MAGSKEGLEKLHRAIMEFNEEYALEVSKELIKAGEDPFKMMDIMGSALSELGDQFQEGEVFLPEILLASDAFKACVSILEPELQKKAAQRKAERRPKVIIGTVKGDVHQVGKDMVAIFLGIAGFDVVDLGVDVPPARFLEAAKTQGADIIGLSALMTTTLPAQKEMIEYLKAGNVRDKYKVMVGGGPCSPEWAESIDSDGYGQDAYEAVDVAKGLLK